MTNDSPGAAAGLAAGTLVTKVDDQVIASGDALLAAVQAKGTRHPGDRGIHRHFR